MTKPIAKNQPQLTTITFAGIALPSGVLLDMDPLGGGWWGCYAGKVWRRQPVAPAWSSQMAETVGVCGIKGIDALAEPAKETVSDLLQPQRC